MRTLLLPVRLPVLLFVLLALFVPLAAGAAENCPPVTIAPQASEPLFERLRDSKSNAEARQAASKIWQVWTKAPDAHAQDLLDRAMRSLRNGDPGGAERVLDELVAHCPGYAEGWNQRAIARFIAGNLDGTLGDIDRVLELEPRHFGALAGKAMTLLRQGRDALAQQALRAAVALHPWMPERGLLPPGEKI